MQTFDRYFGSGPRIHLTMLSLMVIVYAIRSHFFSTTLASHHGSLLSLGLIALACWAIFWIWALVSLGRKIGLQVLQSGPYRFVRHPMYITEMLFGWIIVMFVFNTWLAIPGFFITLFLAQSFVRYEEELMQDAFGDAWITYAKRTPKFFPRCRHSSTK